METLRHLLNDKGRNLHVIDPHVAVTEAVAAMCAAHIGALLVMDDDTLVGIFSERDLMTRVVLTGLEPSRTTVRDVMTKDVICVAEDLTLPDAMAIMTRRRVRHLPVVDGRRVIGLVSIGDAIRWTVRDHEVEIGLLQEYISGRYPG